MQRDESSEVSENRTADSVSGVLLVLGLLGGLVELAYRPFLLAPVAVLVTMVGVVMSSKYRRLSLVAALVIAICFVIGAAITVWYSRPLY